MKLEHQIKKQYTKKGWGLLLYLSHTKLSVQEVIVGNRKPHYGEFYDGEMRSRIIPVKITYQIESPLKIKNGKISYDYFPRTY